jgi:hypothetical protein
LLSISALFWWNFGAEALHTVNAKTAGRVLPSLPYEGFPARVVFAEMKVLHPIAVAADGFARRRWNRLQRSDFGPSRAFADDQIAVAEAHRQRTVEALFHAHRAAAQPGTEARANLALFFLRSQAGTAINNGKLRLIEEISEEAGLAADESRAISYNLRPFQLDRLGLSKAIEGIIRRLPIVRNPLLLGPR